MTVNVGDELGPLEVRVTRADLVRYAGASLDFNPIHWNERVAGEVGLPGVIAHGMLTMALGGRLVSEWARDPGALLEYGVRFTRPVVVPDGDEGATVMFTGKITDLTHGVATVLLTAKFAGQTVLGKAVARVRIG
ncbi:MAG: MaoC/PaaZ C-terminal domain-containing protein [Sciscionella sp.]